MILEKYEYNNGYRCSCCSSGYNDSDWIEESEALSFEELLDKAYDFNNNIDGKVNLQYEKDGKILYGYDTYFGKRYTRVYILIGENNYQIVADGTDDKIFSKKEIIDIFKEHQING